VGLGWVVGCCTVWANFHYGVSVGVGPAHERVTGPTEKYFLYLLFIDLCDLLLCFLIYLPLSKSSLSPGEVASSP